MVSRKATGGPNGKTGPKTKTEPRGTRVGRPLRRRVASDALEQLRDKRIAEDPDLRKAWEALEAKRKIVRVLRDLRARANLTQKDVAERAEWPPSFVSRLESFPREGEKLYMPDVMTIQRYAEVCGSDLNLIFAEPAGRGSGIHISGAVGLGDNLRLDRAMAAFANTVVGVTDKTVRFIRKAKASASKTKVKS